MKKKIVLILFMFIFILCTTSCTTIYTRSDIKEFVEENLGVSDFVVSKEYKIRKERYEDDYEDKVWTVTVRKTGLQFHVIDDVYNNGDFKDNCLITDYNEAVLHFIQDKLPALQQLKIDYTSETLYLYEAKIIGIFENEEELKVCYDELLLLNNAFSDLGYSELAVYYNLKYQHSLRYMSSREISLGDSDGYTNAIESYDEMLKRYMITALIYRFDVIDSFSDEQIAKTLADYDRRIGIYHGTQSDRKYYEPNKITYYDDIIAKEYGDISFGAMYEILRHEGFELTGDLWHYSFTGSDGNVYEISYYFWGYPYTAGNEITGGYYYLKSGEKTPLDGLEYYSFFSVEEVEKMTGLRLVTDVITD